MSLVNIKTHHTVTCNLLNESYTSIQIFSTILSSATRDGRIARLNGNTDIYNEKLNQGYKIFRPPVPLFGMPFCSTKLTRCLDVDVYCP